MDGSSDEAHSEENESEDSQELNYARQGRNLSSNEYSHRQLDDRMDYQGEALYQGTNAINDQEKREQQTLRGMKSSNSIEDAFNKKQMEFKGGKVHQLISDQPKNNNKIFANRY